MDLNASTSLAISTENDECFPKSEAYDDFRFALVAYVGSPIAVLGIFSNAILIVSQFFTAVGAKPKI